MGLGTKIEWAHASWNSWQGCTKLKTPACDNCYAAAYGRRFGITWGEGAPRRRVKGRVASLRKIVRAAQRVPGEIYRVFPESHGDIFDVEIPDAWFAEKFGLMCEAVQTAPNIRFLALTKRIGQVLRRLRRVGLPTDFFEREAGFYLGVTAEDQLRWNTNIKKLASIPARTRFVSAEPLLEPVSLEGLPIEMLHWLIIGGESGPGARPFSLSAAWSLMEQAREHQIPVFMKQFGRRPVARRGRREHVLQLEDSAGGDMGEWPKRFRIRRLPEVRA